MKTITRRQRQGLMIGRPFQLRALRARNTPCLPYQLLRCTSRDYDYECCL